MVALDPPAVPGAERASLLSGRPEVRPLDSWLPGQAPRGNRQRKEA